MPDNGHKRLRRLATTLRARGERMKRLGDARLRGSRALDSPDTREQAVALRARGTAFMSAAQELTDALDAVNKEAANHGH